MAPAGNRSLHTLVVSNQDDTIYQIQRILAAARNYYVQFALSGQEATQIVGQRLPDLVIVDDTVDGGRSLDFIRQLALLAPNTPMVALAEETAVSFMREALLAGARAFVTKPLEETEVVNSLNRLVQMENLRHDHRQQDDTTPRQRCQIITVMSPKDGVGTTTISLNLAVALQARTQARVVLVDGQSSLGDLETALNLQTQYTFGEIVNNGANMDADLVRGVLTKHSSGIRVLASSHNLEDSERSTADLFEKTLRYLSSEADYIVIDAGSIFEEQTSVALNLADTVLLVATPEVTTLRRITLFLKMAEEHNFSRERMRLVINRDGVRGGIAAEDISQRLKMPVAVAIPEDVGLTTYALNRGIPLVTSDPRSAVARSIQKLAQELTPKSEVQDTGAEDMMPRRLFGKLTTMLRSSPA